MKRKAEPVMAVAIKKATVVEAEVVMILLCYGTWLKVSGNPATLRKC